MTGLPARTILFCFVFYFIFKLFSWRSKKSNYLARSDEKGPHFQYLWTGYIVLHQKNTRSEVFFQTCSVVMDLFRVANPHVADQASHSPRLQFTVLQSHLISRASFSGGCGQVCGRPLQSGLNTSTAVSTEFDKGRHIMSYWVQSFCCYHLQSSFSSTILAISWDPRISENWNISENYNFHIFFYSKAVFHIIKKTQNMVNCLKL